MLKEMMIARAEIVESYFSVLVGCKTILGTFSMASKEKVTILALAGKLMALNGSKGLLFGSIKHGDE